MANLKTVLGRIKQSGNTEKTAAAKTEETTPTKGALEAAVNKTAGTITAAATVPVPEGSGNASEELMKIAENLIGAEKQAEVEEAKLLGAAFADGALTKFAMHETQLAEKTASQVAQVTPTAVDTDTLVKMAAEIGYQDTCGRLLKVAAEEEEKDKKDDKKDDKKGDKKGDKKDDVSSNIPAFLKKKDDSGKDDDDTEKKEADFNAGCIEAVQQAQKASEFEFLKGAAIAEHMVNIISQRPATVQ